MGKDKLRKFRENLTFDCFVQPEFDEVFRRDHPLKGHWHDSFFRNDNPSVLELGCGKGEYTVALAERDPSRNYIGIDIKGARMWRGAKTATERGMRNVGFLRTRIEFITSFFAPGEVSELWITFHDPQLNDSTQMTVRNRDRLRAVIEREAVAWAVEAVSAARVAKINILHASFEGMSLAVARLDPAPAFLAIDGNRFRTRLDRGFGTSSYPPS